MPYIGGLVPPHLKKLLLDSYISKNSVQDTAKVYFFDWLACRRCIVKNIVESLDEAFKGFLRVVKGA